MATLPTILSCVVLTVTVFSNTGASAQTQTWTCYSCNSSADARCGDPFSAAYSTVLPTCSAKHCTKTFWTVAGYSGVVRGCSNDGDSSTGAECTGKLNLFGLKMNICYCSGNFCNAATRGVSASHWLTLVVMVMVAMTSILFRRQ